MDFLILVGQRKQRYDGEFAPEALEVIDEIGDGDNPDFLIEKMSEHQDSGDFESIATVRVRVPSEAIARALKPVRTVIIGEVITDPSKPIPPPPIVLNAMGFETDESAKAREAWKQNKN